LTSLEERVAALEAEARVRALFASYCSALDEGNGDRLGALFVPDACLVSGGRRIESRDAIVAYCRDAWERRDWARHIVGAVSHAGAGPTSTAQAPLQFISRTGERTRISVGTYSATVAHGDGECRFVELTVSLEFDGPTDGHRWDSATHRGPAPVLLPGKDIS
jgi:uncharacterized protein (TIGR02246 family)